MPQGDKRRFNKLETAKIKEIVIKQNLRKLADRGGKNNKTGFKKHDGVGDDRACRAVWREAVPWQTVI